MRILLGRIICQNNGDVMETVLVYVVQSGYRAVKLM